MESVSIMYPSIVNRDKKLLAEAHGFWGSVAVTSILKLSPAINMGLSNWSFACTPTTIGWPALTLVGISNSVRVRLASNSATTVTAIGNVRTIVAPFSFVAGMVRLYVYGSFRTMSGAETDTVKLPSP
jgi:hypothetical protein